MLLKLSDKLNENMRLNKFEFRPYLTTDLSDLQRLEDRCLHFVSIAIGTIRFKLAVNKDVHDIPYWMSLDFGQFGPLTTEFYFLERLNNSHSFKWEYGVYGVFLWLFLIRAFSNFQLKKSSTKAWMGLNFGRI